MPPSAPTPLKETLCAVVPSYTYIVYFSLLHRTPIEMVAMEHSATLTEDITAVASNTPANSNQLPATPPTGGVESSEERSGREAQLSDTQEQAVEMEVQQEYEGSPSESSPSSKKQLSQVRHESIVAFAEQYSLSLASKRFSIPVPTIKTWMKAGQASMNPKYNSPGQGRKLSYSSELEQTMADHVRDLLAKGEKVSTQLVRSYARSIVQEEVPDFTASTGWAQRFLARNNIDLLAQNEGHKVPPTPPKEPKTTNDTRGRPLSYSVETDQTIANYVRQTLATGQSISNSELRRYAKELIIQENPNFTGSASWAQNFLLRHKLSLQTPGTRDVPSHMTSALASNSASSSASLLSSPSLLSTPPQYVTSLASSTHLATADTSLSPATEIHVSSAHSNYPNSNMADSVMHIPAEYVSDDPMKQALAVLTGDNIDASILTAEQLAMLQSSLSELTSETVSLADLLNTAQHLQEQAGESGAVALITHGLDSSATAGLYLGIGGGSDAFSSGLTGVAATQVNPNTQAPTIPQLPRVMATNSQEIETNPSSRPLSYAKETDQQLAKWVQEQQADGKKVTFASLRAHAKKLVSSENPNFNASVGWVTPFLLRHRLDLSVNKKKGSQKTTTPRRIEASEEGEEQMEEEPLVMSEETRTLQVHRIPPEEEQIGTGLVMAPIQDPVSASSGTQTPPVTASSLNGIRAILDQGMQGLESQPQQVQYTDFQSGSSLASVVQTSTPLTHSASDGTPLSTVSQLPAQLPEGGLGLQQDGQVVGGEERAPQGKRGEASATPVASATKPKATSSQKNKGRRARHTLSEKLEVVKLMRENGLSPHYVCRMLGVANSTLAGWIKLVQQKGAELEALSLNKKRSNLSGQGRPLTYSREKDEVIAQWVQTQQKMGIQVMPAELGKYAQRLIREENKNFTASSGWAQKFLQRNGLQLAAKNIGNSSSTSISALAAERGSPAIVEDQHEIPAAIQTEEVIAHEYSFEKPYSEETERQLVAWVKNSLQENESLSVQALCHHAEEVVVEQNPMFVASLGWAFTFLFSHGLMLDLKPNVGGDPCTPVSRKRANTSGHSDTTPTAIETPTKKSRPDLLPDATVSPSTGNLCEALLALSNQAQDSGMQIPSNSSVQAALQVALQAIQQQQQQHQQQQQQLAQGGIQVEVGSTEGGGDENLDGGGREEGVEERVEICGKGQEEGDMEEECVATQERDSSGAIQMAGAEKDHNSSNTYFGKPAREFSAEEKEEVVRYANATTLQKAAIKYGVAAPTVWRWRVELKLHQPKYSAMQKKYIIKFAETNSLKEAAQRYGITGKTIQNWRKALQADGELTGDLAGLMTGADIIESASQESEVVTYDTQNFQFIVDGGEVVEMAGAAGSGGGGGRGGRVRGGGGELGGAGGPEHGPPLTGQMQVSNVPLEVTNEVDIENVGMEYDVISSEGHVAKPRCTPQEKMHILQYALDHSIKDASQKFGVSPGTLYYWKRMRNTGKDGGKGVMSSGAAEASVPTPGQPIKEAAPELTVQYSGLSGEVDVLASATTANRENDGIQSEQFITTTVGSSMAVEPAAALQSLSQVLAGMGPEALQQLPELSLLQAVSSLLTGAGAGGGGEENKVSLDKRRDSNGGGISSPTEVLVQPFPQVSPGEGGSGGEGGDGRRREAGEGEGGGKGMEEVATQTLVHIRERLVSQMVTEEGVGEVLTPQVVTEEVITMGDSSEVAPHPGHEDTEPGGEASIGIPSGHTLTPLEPVTAIAVSAVLEETVTDVMGPSTCLPEAPLDQSQGKVDSSVELEVFTAPEEPSNQQKGMECQEVVAEQSQDSSTVTMVTTSQEPTGSEQ